MSEENVHAVKALFAAFAERDSVAAEEVLHPELEIRPALVGGLEGNVYRGPVGNAQFWADIDAAWMEFRTEPDDFIDLGDRVVVLGRAFALGRQSGVALEQRTGWLAEIRDGKIVRFESFSDEHAALEAAGLSE